MDFDLALASAMGVIFLSAPALPVDFSLEFEHRGLLLFADSDRGRSVQLLNLINLDSSIGRIKSDGAPFLLEVLFGELCIVFLFPMPITFVPN